MVSARGRPPLSSPHFAALILSFIAAVHGSGLTPHGPDRCHVGCRGSGGGLGFDLGYRYEYNYHGSSRMLVGASSEPLSPLDLSATVYVVPITSCSIHLRLSEVRLRGPKNKVLESDELHGRPPSGVVAGLDGTGRLSSQMCSAPDQSTSLTNLYRAVLSLLQTHLPKHAQPSLNSSLHQTDIFGVCSTDYSIEETAGKMEVNSIRDLDSCAHREDARLPLITSPYHSRSGFERTRVLEGSQSRKQRFINRVLQEAISSEHYHLAAVSDQSAASVSINTKLNFVSRTKTSAPGMENYKAKSVIFEVINDDGGTSTWEEMKDLLMKLSEGKMTVKEESPRMFRSLVRKLAIASKQDIEGLLIRIQRDSSFKNKPNARRILLDGVVESSSSAAVQVLCDLLKKGDVTGQQAETWLMSFSNTKQVSQDALISIKEVLESGVVPVRAYLGIGTLVGRYCTEQDCSDSDVIDSIQDILIKPLYDSCKPTNFVLENNIVAGLKGLGNMRRLSERSAARLSHCASDKLAWVRVRVAALQTMSSDSTKQIVRETAAKILKDIKEDSEIRIRAYLALIQKPSAEVTDIIKQVLATEKSNQVGGFIVSHLRNIRSSTNPDKEAARHHLGGIYTRSGKFGWDPKKYSQNYELSYNSDSWGAAAEADVIYSQKGYLPRSVTFNLTTILYGHAFNLFEIGIRTEGTEKIFEKLLKSLSLKRENVNNLLKNGTELVDDFANKFSDTLRPKRSIPSDKIKQFYKKLVQRPDVYHDRMLFDMSLKTLGAEVGFWTHLGDDIGPHKSMDEFFNGLQYSIDSAKNLNVEYSKHMTFMEGEVIYPTGLGIPMRVKTSGTAAFAISAEAKMDIPSVIHNPLHSHHMKLKIIPSGSVEVVGSLTLDAGNTESGVEVTLSAHSATGGDIGLKVAGGRELEIVVGVPLREQRIVSLSTSVSSLHRHGDAIKITPIDLDINKVSIEEYSGCFEQLSVATGLTLCGEVSVPNNNMPTINPLYGPSKFAISLHVEDSSITSYVFRTVYQHLKDKNKKKFLILMDTPGSTINRKMSFGYESETNADMKHVKVGLQSSWKSISVEGSLLESEKEVSASGKVKYGSNEYWSKAGMTLAKSSPTVTVYTPFFRYSWPRTQSRLVGRSDPLPPAIKISGEVLVERKEESGLTTYLFNRLTVETHHSNYTVDGLVSTHHHSGSSDFNCDLKVVYDDEYVAINSTLSRPDATRLEGHLSIYPSQNPLLAFKIQGRVESVTNQDYRFLAELDLTHGPDPDNKNFRFSFVNDVLVTGLRENSVTYLAVKHSVIYPPAELRVLSDLEWLPRNLRYKLQSKLDRSNADLKLTIATEPSGPYDIYLAAKIMDKGFKVEARREVVEPGKSKFTNSLEIFEGKLFQVDALVSHKLSWSDLDLSVQSEIKTPLVPKHIRLSAGVQNNDEKVVGRYFLEADSRLYVDFFCERVKGPHSQGNFKLLLTDYIDSKGDFGLEDSVLKGSGYIILLKSLNKVDAAVDMTMKYPKYDGSLDIVWNSPGETPKTIKFITGSEFKDGGFDSKNTLSYGGQDNQLNLVFKSADRRNEGSTQIGFELKIGELNNVATRYSSSWTLIPGDSKEEYALDVMHKCTANSSPTGVQIKLVGDHIDFDMGKIDGRLTFNYVTPEQKDFVLQISHKKMPGDNNWIVNCSLDASGSLIDYPVGLKVDSELSHSLMSDGVSWNRLLPPSSCKILASLGQDYTLDALGKIEGGKFGADFSLGLPDSYRLTSLKWSTDNFVRLHPGPDNKRQVKSLNIFKWNNKMLETECNLTLEDERASFKLDWQTESTQKRSIHLASHWPMKHEGKVDFDLSFKYDKDGKASDAFLKYTADFRKGEGKLHFHGTCPANGLYDLQIASKRLQDGKGVHTEWLLVANNRTTKALFKMLPLPDHPYLEYYIEDENRAKSGFLIKADKKGAAEWTGNVHVEWPMEAGNKGFFYVNSEVRMKSKDDFLIRTEANSNKYRLKDWLVEIRSLQDNRTSASKNVAFKMMHDSNTLLNGTASYDMNFMHSGIYKVQAEGAALLHGTLQPLSLKASWKPTAPNRQFNGTVVYGDNTLTLESVFTESEIYYIRRFCSSKLDKKCSEAKIIWSSLHLNEEDKIERKLEVVLDISSIDPSYNDLELRAHFNREKNTIDQSIEVQWFKNRKFTYLAFVNHDKAGFAVGLPNRTISGEATFQLPQDINQGHLLLETDIWLDRFNKPEEKTHMLVSGELASDKEQYMLATQSKFSHPSLEKDFGMKGKASVGRYWSKPKSEGHFEFDVFKRTDDTVSLSWKVGSSDEKASYSSHTTLSAKSKGLKLDIGYERQVAMSKTSVSWTDIMYYTDQAGTRKDMSTRVDIKPNKFLLSMKLPDVSMYEVDFTLEKKERKISMLGNYELAGTKYREAIRVSNYNNINYQFHFGKGKTLHVDLGFAFGQMAEFKASLNKNAIYEWEVALNEADFLRTKHNYSKENFNQLWKTVSEEMTTISNSFDKEIRRAVDRDGKALNLLIRKMGQSVADFSPLLQSYLREFHLILEEIVEDEALKQAIIPLRTFLSSVVEQCVVAIEELMKLCVHATTFIHQVSDYAETLTTSIAAKIKAISNSMTTVVSRLFESSIDLYLDFVDRLCNEFNKHHKEIQAITTAFSEFSQDVGRLGVKFAKQIIYEFENFIRVSWEEFKQMPLFQLVEEKLKELKSYKVSEGFWPDIQEILRTLAESAPNPELKRFIITLTDHIDQYVKDDTIDLEAAGHQLYIDFVASIKPTIDSIYDALTQEQALLNSHFWVPLPWVSLWKAGTSSGGIRLSTIKWLLSGDLPSFIDYGLHSWNSFCHIIPPYKARGYLVGGEIVTYDGRHVSLDDGSYVLAQQIDNEFTILLQIDKSAVTSIQLSSQTNSIHLTADGRMWVDGKEVNHEVKSGGGDPVISGRFTLSGARMETDQISVICQSDLNLCRVVLKAPAFAKVFGILGTYNYESFDEFTMPSGDVASAQEEFLDSWKVEGGAAGKRRYYSKNQQRCTQLFTGSNQFMLCYRLVDPKPFREMCDRAVEKAKSPEAKKIALCRSISHYTRACRDNNLKISLPPPCDVCQVGNRDVTSDEFEKIKSPAGKADIVFLVQLQEDNQQLYNDLLQPLIGVIDQHLASAGIRDVEYGLVGFGSKQLSYVNFKKGGKLQMKESLPVSLPWDSLSSHATNQSHSKSSGMLIDTFWDVVDKIFIADDKTDRGIARARTSEMYPWRPGSYRSLVSLVSSSCPLPEPILSPLARIKMAQRLLAMKTNGIVYNLITPVKDLLMPSSNNNKIFGFSKEEVYLMNGETDSEARRGITYDYDACHLFAMETGGSVFMSDRLSGMADGVGKQVSRSLLAQTPSYQCQCTINHGLYPKYECRVSS